MNLEEALVHVMCDLAMTKDELERARHELDKTRDRLGQMELQVAILREIQ